MIVVVTNNGCRYINEAAITMLSHIKDEAMVEVWPKCMSVTGVTLEPTTIHDVERVIYTTKDEYINDPGRTVEELEEKLSAIRNDFGNLRERYLDIENKYAVTSDKLKKYENAEPKPEHKIKLRAVTPIGSDCTQGFECENCEGMTAISFIMAVIKNDPYVTIDIKRGGKYLWKGEYENNRLKKEYDNTMPEDFNFLKVKSARAAGGWGQMSYDVIIE